MNKEITIILADDHPLIRKGLRETIEEDSKLRIVAEVNNGQEAIEAIEKFNPQITILDIDMPVINGFDAARTIQEKKFPTAIIFLTMHRDEDMFNEAIDLGAKGFVLKQSALTDIVECIEAVLNDEHYTSRSLTTFLVNRSRRSLQSDEKQPSINDLTPTERRILTLIAEELTSKAISEKLFISQRTVDKHRENICKKLNLQGNHSLFKFAVRNKSKLL